MHIDILLITYNRPVLLAHTLSSLAAQTYRQFTVHLVDNGSVPPVDTNVIPSGMDVRLTRLEQNQSQVEIGNAALKQMHAPIFVSLADDDVWTPHTLEIVATLFAQNAEMEALSCGFSFFDHAQNQAGVDDDYFHQFSGQLQRFNAREVGLADCNSWGIGEKANYKLPRMAHSSVAFFKRVLLDRTIARQGTLFIQPFGDIGYVGCCFNTNYIHYLDLPLGVIGRGTTRETDSAKAGGREKLQNAVAYLEYSPLRACSFFNMGADAHLKVLQRNGVCETWDCRLNLDFFVSHIDHVAADVNITEQTTRDLEEAIPHAIETAMRGLNRPEIPEAEARSGYAKGLLDYILERLNFHAERHQHQALIHGVGSLLGAQPARGEYSDIVDYARWQEQSIALPMLGLQGEPARRATYEAAK